MAKQWEITGRLGELQMQWLRAHYSQEQLEEALARLPKKGFPLNVARRLEAAGGPRMPRPAELLAAARKANKGPLSRATRLLRGCASSGASSRLTRASSTLGHKNPPRRASRSSARA
jgi:hypothetical protein